MIKFFGFEKKRNIIPAKAEIHNQHDGSLKSEFLAHQEIMKSVGPKPVSQIMWEFNGQLKQANMNIPNMRRILIEEYLILEKMGMSESEMRDELKQKLRQFLPRK